jgi:uncharacterized membrane protein
LRQVDKNTLQTLGFGLIIVGVLLLMIGIIGQNTPTNCPVNGCPPDVLWRIYGPSIISLYSGMALIAVGIILLFVARRMKPRIETNRKAATTP